MNDIVTIKLETPSETQENTWVQATTKNGVVIHGVYDQPVSAKCHKRMIEVSRERDFVGALKTVTSSIPVIGMLVRKRTPTGHAGKFRHSH